MLLLHEVHTLVGRHEEAFADHVRNGWLPYVASDADARLGWYLTLAHGTGRAYQATTVTLLRDGAAYERLARRVQYGDLCSWAAHADTMRHEVVGKLLLPVAWSPALPELDAVPVVPGAPGPDATGPDSTWTQALFMEDSAWPFEGKLDEYLEAARTHYAPSLDTRSERSLLELVALPGGARRATSARGRAVAAGAVPRATPGAVHPGPARGGETTGDVDA